MTPIRYFLVNTKTNIAHAYDCCPQTKTRSIPIRLFEDWRELEVYAQHRVVLCRTCSKRLEKEHQ